MDEIEMLHSAMKREYNANYKHGEYCHEQSFSWGFQEGYKKGKEVFKENVLKFLYKCREEAITKGKLFDWWDILDNIRDIK